MKYVLYKDSRGYIRRSLVKDTDSETQGALGVPSGPPDLDRLDWGEIRAELNNALVKANLFTWQDVQQHPAEFMGCLNVIRRYLVALYRDQV